jgi:hypothetical protein
LHDAEPIHIFYANKLIKKHHENRGRIIKALLNYRELFCNKIAYMKLKKFK